MQFLFLRREANKKDEVTKMADTFVSVRHYIWLFLACQYIFFLRELGGQPRVTAQRFNQNYSNAASVLFRPGSEADFGSPERTETYVRKAKLESGSGMGKNHVAFE